MSGRTGHPRRVERGEISWVTLVLVVVVASGAYLGWVWLPLYSEHYAVKQVVRDYMNQAIKNPHDDELRRNMVLKLRSLDRLEAVDAEGRPALVPAVVVDERDVVWEREAHEGGAPTLRIAFAYERTVVYPLVGRTDVRIFEVDLTGDLARADWGPAR